MYYYLLLIFGVLFCTKIQCQTQDTCNIICPEESPLICGFDVEHTVYKLFNGKCSLAAHSECHNITFIQTPVKYCIKQDLALLKARRMISDEDSCPVFCPSHYRPVCGASRTRSYVYRTFNNGCYLEMLNCRGDEDSSQYVEVPLEFCQRHAMKNVFKEKILIHNSMDYKDYGV